jgi:hypothetical protein
MKAVILILIKIYQKTISLDHGLLGKIFPAGACRYRPTCSQYGYQAIDKYGLIEGGWRSAKRIARCHPFAKGGHDPVE